MLDVTAAVMGLVTFSAMVLSLPACAGGIALVRDGVPAATIVAAERPPPAVRLAALELQHHIHQMTGATLPIEPPDGAVHGTPIMVGESAATWRLGLRGRDFAPQEYLIRVAREGIVLMGRDWQGTVRERAEIGMDTHTRSLQSWRKRVDYNAIVGRGGEAPQPIELPGVLDDQGTCYAVYDFLERLCGVRWYGPTPLNVVVPTRRTLAVDRVEVRRTPSLLHRHGAGGGWPIIAKQWGHPTSDQIELYYRRLRFGGERWAANHSLYGWLDRFVRKNPDCPEVFEGEHREFWAQGYEASAVSQLCYTSPAVVQRLAQEARDYFDGKGLKHRAVACGDYFVVEPMDDNRWCQCPRCQEMLAIGAEDEGGRGHFNNAQASYYMFSFVNAVAREVAKTHPDKYIATLAYMQHAHLPRGLQLEPNVSIAPCLQVCYYYSKPIRKNELTFYEQWTADRKRRVYLWNYFHHPLEPAIIGGWKAFPCFMPEVVSGEVKRYVRDGVRGVFLCGIGEQLDYYILMQTAFSAATDWRQVVDEFFSRYFGPAGEPLKRFYLRISEINREEGTPGTTPELSWERLGTDECMAELGALMAEAEALAQTDSEKRRVATWKEGVWDYMAEGKAEYAAAHAED